MKFCHLAFLIFLVLTPHSYSGEFEDKCILVGGTIKDSLCFCKSTNGSIDPFSQICPSSSVEIKETEQKEARIISKPDDITFDNLIKLINLKRAEFEDLQQSPQGDPIDHLFKLITEGSTKTSTGALTTDESPLRQMEYVLAFKSQSTQPATSSSPRIIVFNKTSNLIMTFNHANSEAGNNSIETVTFDSKTGRPIFREISFPFDFSKPIPDPPESDEKCLKCHGDNLGNQGASGQMTKFIWEAYPLWPGMLNQADIGVANFAKLSQEERDVLTKLNSQWPSLARYKWFTDPATQIKPKNNGYEIIFPNTVLGEKLTSWNRGRVLKSIVNDDFFKQAKYAFIGALYCSDKKMTDFFPIDKGLASYETVLEKLRKANNAHFRKLVLEVAPQADVAHRDTFPDSRTHSSYKQVVEDEQAPGINTGNDQIIARMRQVLEYLGPPYSEINWSMSFNREAQTYNNGSYDDMSSGIARTFFDKEMWTKALLDKKSVRDASILDSLWSDELDDACVKLIEASKGAFAITSAVDCHSESLLGPGGFAGQGVQQIIQTAADIKEDEDLHGSGQELYKNSCLKCHENNVERSTQYFQTNANSPLVIKEKIEQMIKKHAKDLQPTPDVIDKLYQYSRKKFVK